MKPSNFVYYGAFLGEKAKSALNTFLQNDEECKQVLDSAQKVFLDHCTLVHRSQLKNNPHAGKLANALHHLVGHQVNLIIDAIGKSDKALAFKVSGIYALCENRTPHITIATFNNGKPVDSNTIEDWRPIEPIHIKGTIYYV